MAKSLVSCFFDSRRIIIIGTLSFPNQKMCCEQAFTYCAALNHFVIGLLPHNGSLLWGGCYGPPNKGQSGDETPALLPASMLYDGSNRTKGWAWLCCGGSALMQSLQKLISSC